MTRATLPAAAPTSGVASPTLAAQRLDQILWFSGAISSACGENAGVIRCRHTGLGTHLVVQPHSLLEIAREKVLVAFVLAKSSGENEQRGSGAAGWSHAL